MTEQELYTEILMLLGCGIQSGRVFDFDTRQYLIYNGNYITTPESLIIHKRDVQFDPLKNSKLCEYLVNVVIQKESKENGLYVQAMHTIENPESIPPCIGRGILLVTNNGTITTEYYYNYCLACIDLIHRICQVPTPAGYLRSFDYTKSQLLEIYDAKNKGRSKK